jgi:queuine tRNA-ribosyltransferase
MGVGSPEDLVECVGQGYDLFDSALPTRIARSGSLLVGRGRANIDTAPWRRVDGPIEDGCDCYTCASHSAAYLHHLFRSRELLAYRLATIHNLRFVLRLMAEMRAAIRESRFEAYRAAFMGRFVPPDESTRRDQRREWRKARGRRDAEGARNTRRSELP